MKTLTVTQLMRNFSNALKTLNEGEEIGILYGRKKELIATLVPVPKVAKARRKLGILEGKMKVEFAPDFKMTTEEFLGES